MTQPLPPATASIDQLLTQIETQLAGIHAALQATDPTALENQSAQLHQSLSQLMHAAAQAGDLSQLPTPLRERLAAIAGQIGTQREWLARSSAQVDRTLNALLQKPSANPATALYSPKGTPGGSIGT